MKEHGHSTAEVLTAEIFGAPTRILPSGPSSVFLAVHQQCDFRLRVGVHHMQPAVVPAPQGSQGQPVTGAHVVQAAAVAGAQAVPQFQGAPGQQLGAQPNQ